MSIRNFDNLIILNLQINHDIQSLYIRNYIFTMNAIEEKAFSFFFMTYNKKDRFRVFILKVE